MKTWEGQGGKLWSHTASLLLFKTHTKALALPDRICKEMADPALTVSSQLVTSPVTLLQRTGSVYPYKLPRWLGGFDLASNSLPRCGSIIFLHIHHQFQYTLQINSSKWITVRMGFKVTEYCHFGIFSASSLIPTEKWEKKPPSFFS